MINKVYISGGGNRSSNVPSSATNGSAKIESNNWRQEYFDGWLTDINWIRLRAIPQSIESLTIHINGITQRHNVDYTVDGRVITFDGLISTGNNIIADYIGKPGEYDQSGATYGDSSPTYYKLEIQSSPTSIDIAVDKTDIGGDSDGTTTFEREYVEDEVVELTAPAEFGTYYSFEEWEENASQYDDQRITNVTVDSDRILIANYKDNRFRFTVKTNNSGLSNDDQFALPLVSWASYDFYIDWGDDTIEHITTNGNIFHTYPAEGTYTVSIYDCSSFSRIFFNNGGDKLKIIDLIQWGDVPWSHMKNSFTGCRNMALTATDRPDWSNVTNFDAAFSDCHSITSFTDYDVSNGTTFNGTWAFCKNMRTFTGMAFDSAINLNYAWLMENAGASNHEGPINWDCTTSPNLTSIEGAWCRCVLSDGLSHPTFPFIDTSNVTNAQSAWQESKIGNMSLIDLSSCTNFASAWWGTSFLGFNGEIFPDIDFSNGQNLSYMFNRCANLTLGSIPNFNSMNDGTECFYPDTDCLSTADYSQLLIDLESNNPNDNVDFHGGPMKYNVSGQTARNTLTSAPRNWSITDGGLDV